MFDSPWHWLVVALIAAVLFFKWNHLPDMARSLGRSLRVFKTEIKGLADDDQARKDADDARTAAAQQPAAIEAPRAAVVPVSADVATPRVGREPVATSRPRPAPRPDAQPTPDRPASPS